MKISRALLFILLLCPPPRAFASEVPSYLHGAIVPLVTPYKGPDGNEIDLAALRDLTDYLCSTRISALFPVSGTGQWDRLSLAEKKSVLTTCIAAAKKRKPVLAGVGSPDSLADTLEMARFAQGSGADAIVAVTPAFVRARQPRVNGVRRLRDQRLIEDYYTAVCQAVKIPVIVYDPESEIDPETMGRLVNRCPTIKGMKVREKKDLGKFRRLVEAVRGDAAILSGSEIYALGAIREGAAGMIGNGFNLYPNLGADLMDASDRKDWARAEKLQKLIIEANDKMERLGGGAQGIKKILNDVIGIKMETTNRGDTFRPESHPGEAQEILDYFRKMNLPSYNVNRVDESEEK